LPRPNNHERLFGAAGLPFLKFPIDFAFHTCQGTLQHFLVLHKEFTFFIAVLSENYTFSIDDSPEYSPFPPSAWDWAGIPGFNTGFVDGTREVRGKLRIAASALCPQHFTGLPEPATVKAWKRLSSC
jgi:hypothetical protein